MASVIVFIVWLLNKLISIYMLAIVIYALMSWFPNAYGTAFGRFLVGLLNRSKACSTLPLSG